MLERFVESAQTERIVCVRVHNIYRSVYYALTVTVNEAAAVWLCGCVAPCMCVLAVRVRLPFPSIVTAPVSPFVWSSTIGTFGVIVIR